jgi:methyl-accepting chemotaxis protein
MPAKLEPDHRMTEGATPKSPSPSAERHRAGKFSIKAKLQAAFGIVALMTVIASAVAVLSFAAIQRSVTDLVGSQVPETIDAMQLSILSAEVSAAAARLVSATSPAALRTISELIDDTTHQQETLVERLRKAIGDTAAFSEIMAASKQLNVNLRELQTVISERREMQQRLGRQMDAVHRVHARISEHLAPIVDDAYFDVVMAREKIQRDVDRIIRDKTAPARTDRVSDDVMSEKILELRAALEISALSHLLTSIMSEGSAAKELAALAPIQERFRAAADSLTKATNAIANDEIRRVAADLIGLGQGTDGVFALRAGELTTTARAEETIDQNIAMQRKLDAAVSALAFEAVVDMKDSSAELIGDLDHNRTLLIIVASFSVLSAGAIGTFYVRRRLIWRLTSIGKAMRRLSNGEIKLDIPATADGDEIGEMARSLEVFRTNEIERRSLAERDRAEQAAQRHRAEAIEEMIGEFRARVTAVMRAVTENLARMKTIAQVLSGIANEADQQAQAVSVSSETTSSNVQSVASATEELGGSINEISQQAAQANEVVDRATGIVQSADRQIARLSHCADQIGSVVKAIRDIAEQTNLLALNATIEAARAGEAGRGFAVVASEVKALATQTARATEEISAQIGGIQGSTTEAVDAIRSIGEVMKDIGEFAALIVAAVQEQSTSTHEIARNVQMTANVAKELTHNMAIVTDTIRGTNNSASEVLHASTALEEQASGLEQAVDHFLRKVAAA